MEGGSEAAAVGRGCCHFTAFLFISHCGLFSLPPLIVLRRPRPTDNAFHCLSLSGKEKKKGKVMFKRAEPREEEAKVALNANRRRQLSSLER